MKIYVLTVEGIDPISQPERCEGVFDDIDKLYLYAHNTFNLPLEWTIWDYCRQDKQDYFIQQMELNNGQ